MDIEYWGIADVHTYDKNPRHNDAGVEVVAASLREFGWRQPIVVDEGGMIVVGHTRFKAALKLGMKMVPVHVVRGLTPAQIKAYRIADNQTATLSSWDDELLIAELTALQKEDFDLDLTGFSADELMQMMQSGPQEGLIDSDAVPEPPDEAISKPGDLWLLGNHRLLCGDSAKSEDVDRLLDGATVHLIFSDPPYGVRVEPRSNNAIAAGLSSFGDSKNKRRSTSDQLRAKDRPLENDFLSDEEFGRLLLAWFGNMARVLEPGRTFYLWGGFSNCATYPPALKAVGMYFSQAIIWDKQHPVLTRKDFMGAHEWAFYGWREGKAHTYLGPTNATDLWSVKKINPQSMEHLTQKPVELATRAMQYSSRPGENVLDLFGGSGSTLIGAEQTGRRAFLMEIDTLYCDLIVDRWQRFTGKQAIHAETGEPYPKAPPALTEALR